MLTIANARIAAPIPTPKAIVTITPDVVRELSLFMHVPAAAAGLAKHIRPGAQDAIAVTVGKQLSVTPADTEQSEVDFVVVVEQTSVPVVLVVESVVLAVLNVVESVVVVEEAAALAVVDGAAADEAESVVVVASVLEGAVVDFAVVAAVVFAVVFAVVLAVVFGSVVDLTSVAESVAGSCLFLKSSRSSATSFSWHSCANQIAPTVASLSEHPPAMKHCSICSNRSRSTPARQLEIFLLHPHEVLATRSSILFCAHSVPVAETMAAVANSARRISRMLADSGTRGIERKRWSVSPRR